MEGLNERKHSMRGLQIERSI